MGLFSRLDTATLTGIDGEGDFIALEYTHDIRVLIPETNIRYIAGVELDV